MVENVQRPDTYFVSGRKWYLPACSAAALAVVGMEVADCWSAWVVSPVLSPLPVVEERLQAAQLSFHGSLCSPKRQERDDGAATDDSAAQGGKLQPEL